ncbi:MAG TPA: hypothetical protein VED01_05495, partial [Burkholderiales bacterium]|nr:hypothetical protein [Burkholderiales bacterium]
MFKRLLVAAAVASIFAATAAAQVAVTPGRDAIDARPFTGAGPMTGAGPAADRERNGTTTGTHQAGSAAGQTGTGTGGTLGAGGTTGAGGLVVVPPVPSVTPGLGAGTSPGTVTVPAVPSVTPGPGAGTSPGMATVPPVPSITSGGGAAGGTV